MLLVKLLTLPLRLPRPRSTAAGSSMLKGFRYTHLHFTKHKACQKLRLAQNSPFLSCWNPASI